MDYWGTEDTSVHFCEKKYDQVWWAAEFFNTISSLFYVIVGLFFLGSRLDRLGKGLIGMGFGAWILHMTMRYYGQWIDEIAMLILCFFSAKEVKKNTFGLFIGSYHWRVFFMESLFYLFFSHLYFFTIFYYILRIESHETKEKNLYNRLYCVFYTRSNMLVS